MMNTIILMMAAAVLGFAAGRIRGLAALSKWRGRSGS
jgi:UPF0716 family protein affecting phage T7 exclusion